MSYSFVVEWNIRLKADTPKEVISMLKAWHKHPHRFDDFLHIGIDVGAALGCRDSEGFAGVVPERNFIHGSGVVSYIRTCANFSRRSQGTDRLVGFINWLEPYIDHRGDVIGIMRGEDDLYDIHDDHANIWSDEPQTPSRTYYEIRVVNNHAQIKYVRGDLYNLYPWVQHAY